MKHQSQICFLGYNISIVKQGREVVMFEVIQFLEKEKKKHAYIIIHKRNFYIIRTCPCFLHTNGIFRYSRMILSISKLVRGFLFQIIIISNKEQCYNQYQKVRIFLTTK